MGEAFISIIIPSYNSDKTLPQTIASILNSNYKNFEVIIVDDASNKNLKDYIVENSKIKIIRSDIHKGPAHSRNLGADRSRGDILVFLDSDVYIKADTLLKIKKNFEEEKADAIVGIYDTESPDKNFFSNYYNLRMIKGFLEMPEITETCSSAIFGIKKDIFMKLGGFNLKYRKASVEDREFGQRLTSSGYRMRLDKELSVVHDKRLGLKSILINDFNRAFDRAEFILNFKTVKDILKKKRFNHISLGQLFAVLLTPFFWMSIIAGFLNINFFLITLAFAIFYIYLHKDYLSFNYKKRGLLFSFKSLIFIFPDLSIVWLGVINGLIAQGLRCRKN